ncbi:MAG: FHA domain-containing protein [Eubacteriales bacterium]|nr:FHA domain-containing protein [Eubacteriales bacterium]
MEKDSESAVKNDSAVFGSAMADMGITDHKDRKYLYIDLADGCEDGLTGYQSVMIAENAGKAYIIPEISFKDETDNSCCIRILYDISGCITASEFFKRITQDNSSKAIYAIGQIAASVLYGKELLLDCQKFMLDPEYIFFRRRGCIPRLIYLPVESGKDIQAGIKKLLSLAYEIIGHSYPAEMRCFTGYNEMKAEECCEMILAVCRKHWKDNTGKDHLYDIPYKCHKRPENLKQRQNAEQKQESCASNNKSCSPPDDMGDRLSKSISIFSSIMSSVKKLTLKTAQKQDNQRATGDQVNTVLNFNRKKRDSPGDFLRKSGTGTDMVFQSKEAVRETTDETELLRPEGAAAGYFFMDDGLSYTGKAVAGAREVCGSETESRIFKQSEAVFILVTTEAYAGRDKSKCDFVIRNKTVGRIHACLSSDRGQVWVSDCHSINGTAINGRRLEPGQKYCLADGDVIVFADSRYIFKQSCIKER